MFFGENMDSEKAVSYRPGRFAVFDGNILLQAREVDNLCPALRTIITLKSVRMGDKVQ